ncbi:methyltransferase domain-containing protein [Tahibacter harae]|uniref:Methyltransferase domain-containing protein n=1 Tax=Tahibacter harae TaxID=2963937 RepID=A0ABT1QT35_9GAMM|nr:methyltransferase domain-containing protein [Tahibacter harae]MCQ4165457.1 methyltransferase domain-containing protein [Tahibacter harae]
MSNWSESLSRALASGQPEYMRAALADVPENILQLAFPAIATMARESLAQGKPELALVYYGQLIERVPDSAEWRRQRAEALLQLGDADAALEDARQAAVLAPADAAAVALLARVYEALGDAAQALAATRQALQLGGDAAALQARIAALEDVLHRQALLQRVTDPDAPQPAIELPPLPQVPFDPQVFAVVPEAAEAGQAMRAGLRQHLLRYSAHQSVRNALQRIDDPAWLAAWDEALKQTAGATVLFHGAELGLLPLRAIAHGAARAYVVAPGALETRISGGMVQKNQLRQWREQFADRLASMNEEERQASFEPLQQRIQLPPPDALPELLAEVDVVALPGIDHSLLGTGIAAQVRRYREQGLRPDARVLPARARLFAQGVQWAYPHIPFNLDALDTLRWSAVPEAPEFGPGGWRELTAAVEVGTVDFADFAAATHPLQLPVTASGRLNAVLYWFELDLGAGFGNAPQRGAGRLPPALQYTDAQPVRAGEVLEIDACLSDTRLHFRTRPAAQQLREALLPSWYIPMLLDAERNSAYAGALQRLTAEAPVSLALDIGAGCGLLSMYAAAAGVGHVVGCEISPAIHRVAEAVIGDNGLAQQIQVINKDCRQLGVPADLPQRADLVLFEMFDCSLIGEGVLHFLAYVREHLATADARYLPLAARLRAQVIEYRLEQVLEQDANLLNPYRFSASFINVDTRRLDYRPLSEPFDLFAFDFATATPAAQELELAVPASAAGTAGAVLFWFELQMDADTWLSNAPGSSLHWKQGLQFLAELRVEQDMLLPLLARHNGSALNLRWKDAELPKEAFSRLPRFDPRWWQEVTELEAQTQQLMQHCHGNADEYAKVARLAAQFAADPAAQGLDPRIAQRFLASFLPG